MIWMAFSKSKQGHNFRMEKVVKSDIELGLSFTVPDLVYKYQLICLKGKVIEQKQI